MLIPIPQIKLLIDNACSSACSPKDPSTKRLGFAVDMILRAEDLNPAELGAHRTWMLCTLDKVGDLLNMAEKVEQVKQKLSLENGDDWEGRFLRVALEDSNPLDSHNLILALKQFKDTKILTGVLENNFTQVLGYAAKAKAKELATQMLGGKFKDDRVWNGELIHLKQNIWKLLTTGQESEIRRSFSRGISEAGWNCLENSYSLLRYVPESIRNRLDTLYLCFGFKGSTSELIAEAEGILPIRRLVVNPIDKFDPKMMEFSLSHVMHAFPKIQEVIIAHRWDPCETADLQNALKGRAIELQNAVIIDKEWQRFFCALFKWDPFQIDWSQPQSARYEPEGWQAIEQPPLAENEPLYPYRKRSSLMLTLGPVLVKETETDEKLRLQILKAFKVTPGEETSYVDSFNIDVAEDKVLAPKVLQWIESLWREEKLTTELCQRVVRWWQRYVDTIPFAEHTVRTHSGISSLPAFPLRLAREQRKGSLPESVDCSMLGIQMLARMFRGIFYTRDWERVTPKEWIECARAAHALQARSFWSESYHMDLNRWTKEQVATLKQVAKDAGADRWFRESIYKNASLHSSAYLNVRTVKEIQPTNWWDEIKLLSNGVQLGEYGFENDCNAIMENPAPFQEIEHICWKKPKVEEQLLLAMVCNELPQLKQVTIEFDFWWNKPPVKLNELTFLKDLPPEIVVLLEYPTLSAEEIQTLNEFGKRDRETAPIYVRRATIVSEDDHRKKLKVDLSQTIFKEIE